MGRRCGSGVRVALSQGGQTGTAGTGAGKGSEYAPDNEPGLRNKNMDGLNGGCDPDKETARKQVEDEARKQGRTDTVEKRR